MTISGAYVGMVTLEKAEQARQRLAAFSSASSPRSSRVWNRELCAASQQQPHDQTWFSFEFPSSGESDVAKWLVDHARVMLEARVCARPRPATARFSRSALIRVLRSRTTSSTSDFSIRLCVFSSAYPGGWEQHMDENVRAGLAATARLADGSSCACSMPFVP